ncbi:MAG TPA: dTMP kinase [Candidatus Kapabacteria bacterium]|nr:dTMP kinase [Candidatus Kapabacteria bacterium]
MLITFEGIDGSGKTTQINLLREHLERSGHKVLCLREPGSTSISEKIRETLLQSKEDISPIAEVLLFCAARAQLVSSVIKPALKDGFTVICDRYMDSTVAYQGYGRGVDIAMIDACNAMAIDGLLPTITFILDVQVENAAQRADKRAEEKDRMENAGNDFFINVRLGYHHLAAQYKERIVMIDGTKSIEEISEIICAAII